LARDGIRDSVRAGGDVDGVNVGALDVAFKRNGRASVTGTVYCWGDNATDQLGNGTQLPSYEPTPVVP
jgi:hypothetical protein